MSCFDVAATLLQRGAEIFVKPGATSAMRRMEPLKVLTDGTEKHWVPDHCMSCFKILMDVMVAERCGGAAAHPPCSSFL